MTDLPNRIRAFEIAGDLPVVDLLKQSDLTDAAAICMAYAEGKLVLAETSSNSENLEAAMRERAARELEWFAERLDKRAKYHDAKGEREEATQLLRQSLTLFQVAESVRMLVLVSYPNERADKQKRKAAALAAHYGCHDPKEPA